MGGKALSKCYIFVSFPVSSWDKEKWSKDKVKQWIENAGGKLQKEFVEATTTHVVVDEKAWNNQILVVQRAREANEGGQAVKIVSPDWLENCLSDQKKHPVGTYLWEKLEMARAKSKGKAKLRQAVEGEDGNDEEAPQSHQALIGEVFEESTGQFLSERDRRILEAQQAGEEKMRREREEAEQQKKEQEKRALEQKSRERAAEMRRTRNKGRGKEFNGECPLVLGSRRSANWP